MGFWGWFYAIAVVLTLIHAHVPIDPLRRRQHALGSEVIFISWCIAGAARYLLHDATPLVANALIDVGTSGTFLWIAMRNKALWAAFCVILHAGMSVLHLAYRLSGEGNDLGYIWILNTLFFPALVTINTAIMAGKYEWGALVDELVHLRRGWTFTGLRRSGRENHQEAR